jgi:fucose permease
MMQKNNPSATRSRLGVTIIFAINGFLYASWVSRLPRLQEQFAVSHAELGTALLAVSIGAIMAMPLTGFVIVRTGSRNLTTVAAVLYCLFTPGIPLMPDYGWLWIHFWLLGLWAGTLDVSMNAQAVLVERALAKPVMASFHAWFSAGMLAGAGVATIVNRLEMSLAGHLAMAAAVCLLLLPWAARQLLREDRQATAAEAAASPPLHKRYRPELVGLGLIAFCCMLGEGAMADWSANYLEKEAQAGRYWAPIGLAAFTAAMTGGRFLGDYFRLRLGDERMLRYSSMLAVGGLSLVLVKPLAIFAVPGFFLVGAGLSGIVPIAYSRAANAPGLSPGVGISVVTSIGYAGFLLGPPVIGWIGDWQGLRVGLAFVWLLLLGMMVLSFVLPAKAMTAGTPAKNPGQPPPAAS